MSITPPIAVQDSPQAQSLQYYQCLNRIDNSTQNTNVETPKHDFQITSFNNQSAANTRAQTLSLPTLLKSTATILLLPYTEQLPCLSGQEDPNYGVDFQLNQQDITERFLCLSSNVGDGIYCFSHHLLLLLSEFNWLIIGLH